MSKCTICGITHYNDFVPEEDGQFIWKFTPNPTLCRACEKLWLSWDTAQLEERKKLEIKLIHKKQDNHLGKNEGKVEE